MRSEAVVKTELSKRLATLAAIPALSGSEQQMARSIYGQLGPLVDELAIDRLGNVYGTRRGPTNSARLMITAHMDEVGAMVASVLPSGFLRCEIVGFVSRPSLFASNVLVGEEIRGVVVAPSAYLPEPARGSITPARDLFLDIGARTAAEARRWGVREGSPVTFVNPLSQLGRGDRFCGKAIDNRIGCAILLQLMTNLTQVTLPVTVHAVATVQEETTFSGAAAAAYGMQPDLALLVDTVPSDDTPDAPSSNAQKITLGGGAVFQLAEGVPHAYRGTFAHPAVCQLLIDTANHEQIPCQLSAMYGYWTTDGSAVNPSRTGIPCGYVSVPRRYAHSASEVLDIHDAVAALQVLEAVVLNRAAQIDLRFVAGLQTSEC
jgi:endoglucanase